MSISDIKNSPDLFQRTAGGGVAVVILVVGVINTEQRVTIKLYLFYCEQTQSLFISE